MRGIKYLLIATVIAGSAAALAASVGAKPLDTHVTQSVTGVGTPTQDVKVTVDVNRRAPQVTRPLVSVEVYNKRGQEERSEFSYSFVSVKVIKEFPTLYIYEQGDPNGSKIDKIIDRGCAQLGDRC